MRTTTMLSPRSVLESHFTVMSLPSRNGSKATKIELTQLGKADWSFLVIFLMFCQQKLRAVTIVNHLHDQNNRT